MKKRIISILLSTTLALGAVGCGGGQPAAGQQTKDDAVDTVKDQEEEDQAVDQAEDQEAAEDQAVKQDQPESEEAQADGAEDAVSSAIVEEKPGQEVAEVLPEDSIGPVMFTPSLNGYMTAMGRGGYVLTAYFMRPGVKGAGKISIYSAGNDEKACVLDLSDEKVCYQVPDDGTLTNRGWRGGTQLEILLPEPYENSGTYYVLMDEGAFESEDGSLLSKELKDKSGWVYDVAEYGVDLAVKNGSKVYVGDKLYARVLLRAPAKKAKIEGYDENRLKFEEKEFKHEDGDLRFEIRQIGEDKFYVNFYDAEGELLSKVPVVYEAEMPEDPEKKKADDATINL